ncbi:hypothetical protein IAT38_004772 [Cryptococcus sp. DSM 104549]
MGNWSEEKYDKVFAAKVAQLFTELDDDSLEHDTTNPRPAPSSRSYRQFVKELDPTSVPVKSAFRRLVQVVANRRHRGLGSMLDESRARTSQPAGGASAGPSFRPTTSLLETDNSTRSRFPEPERRRRITESHSSLPYFLGPQSPRPPMRSSFHEFGTSDGPISWPPYEPPSEVPYAGSRLEARRRARARATAPAAEFAAPPGGAEDEWLEPMYPLIGSPDHRADFRGADVNAGGDSWMSPWADEEEAPEAPEAPEDTPSGMSPVNASSRAWLTQYEQERGGQAQPPRPLGGMPPSITELLTRYASAHDRYSSVANGSRRAVPPREWNDDQLSGPTLRRNPSQLLGRRQRGPEEDEEEEERPARRLRTYLEPASLDVSWGGRGRTNRDTRRDGIVFDAEAPLAGVFDNHVLGERGEGEEGEARDDAGSYVPGVIGANLYF